MTRASGAQTRTFNYNTNGILTSATNPKSGTGQYFYYFMVREMDGRNYGTLGIKMEAGVVWINGNDGRKANGELNWCN
jgi:hypothetical protein